MTAYDESNVFARILRGEIPSRPVHEDEHSLAFPDINPLGPTHILVIPKGRYVSFEDFAEKASEAEIVGFVRAIAATAKKAGLTQADGGQGFRLVANAGPAAHQEVPHLHMHLLGGGDLGPVGAQKPRDKA
ncbi:HIT domain-containing protein [Neomegalonema sp.]|uniref:HIT domain-containing protein n=1 Tax=Neomegalonema sp. TaxID=2039713 RepID=UPI002618281C|nr:HIT domain-containing protein [Neomegalonema sp.]MDD2869141.1 HIT domain-containing protein [Neomegalonema sp.]